MSGASPKAVRRFATALYPSHYLIARKLPYKVQILLVGPGDGLLKPEVLGDGTKVAGAWEAALQELVRRGKARS